MEQLPPEAAPDARVVVGQLVLLVLGVEHHRLLPLDEGPVLRILPGNEGIALVRFTFILWSGSPGPLLERGRPICWARTPVHSPAQSLGMRVPCTSDEITRFSALRVLRGHPACQECPHSIRHARSAQRPCPAPTPEERGRDYFTCTPPSPQI